MDPEFIRELFAAFGPVRTRRMFFGVGIFTDGMMFGYAVDGVIYLETDDVIIGDFAAEESGPFLYPTKGGMRPLLSYWRLPERLYDDPEELVLWARRPGAPQGRGHRSQSGSIHLPLGECQELSIDRANDPVGAVVPGGVAARLGSIDP
jgi:DNA transformation protein